MRILLIALCLFATACTSPSNTAGNNSTNNNSGNGNTEAQESSFRDATVASKADGTEIAFTAFSPELAAGETAPLIIHGHGWSLSRIKDFNDPNPVNAFIQTETSSVVSKRAWENGYFVISFDQRGWGESGGDVAMMDPDLEGLDVATLIDWAEENFGAHLTRQGDDPVVGSVGLSYGGGFQTIGSAVDNRFDAIVPVITWHDLRYSLNPGGVPKSVWAAFLVLAGAPTSQFSLTTDLYEALLVGATTLNLPEALTDKLYNNSLISFCEGRADGRGIPDVDAFFVQGSHDVLFNATEASLNNSCLKSAGNDSRLLIQRDGHIVPVVQQSGELILFGLQEEVHCGDQTFNTADMMYNFLDEKLRDGPASNVPEVCISQQETGQALSEMPMGGISNTVQVDNIITGVAVETVMGLLLDLDPGALLSLLTNLPTDLATVVTGLVTGLGNPQEELPAAIPAILNLLPHELLDELLTYQHFAPIHTAEAGKALAGIPTATINFAPSVAETPVDDPIVFVGLAVEPIDGSGRYLVNDQVTPIRGFGDYDLLLPGVSAKLEEGDLIGFVVMPFHTQYMSSFSRVPNAVSVSGSAAAPVIDDQQ